MASSAHNGSRSQTNGVLAVTTSQTHGSTSRQTAVKLPAPRMKVIVRRLAPRLTETEFKTLLGDEWLLGGGKVDWMLYKPGKESKDPSKPSRPSRAYLHLTEETHLLSLSEAVRQTSFEDAQSTYTNQCLVGPPTVEFAPYGRIPGGRPRVDARAGTIDQDPEFMAFLEGLANPITSKDISTDTLIDSSMAKSEKVTTTPLVQYLRDKKANKTKEAAVKAAKKQEAQLAKAKSAKDSTSEDPKKKGKDLKTDKVVEKAAKEAVKILNREAAAKIATAASTPSSEASGSESTATPKLDVTRVPGRQRGAVIAAHIRMLQRDLGLSPAQAHRQVRRDTADAQKAERAAAIEKAAAETKVSTSQPAQASTVPTAPKGNVNQPNNRRVRGKNNASSTSNDSEANLASSSSSIGTAGPSTPIILLKKPDTAKASSPVAPTQPVKPTPATSARKPPPVAIPSAGATQAFVKHANPSQGITEALLKEAMEKFGVVLMVEIDRRKGFANVDFADAEGLKKAMAANPISIAQGTVQVLQRKGTGLPPDKKNVNQGPPARGGRGGRGGTMGRRGGRGGLRGGANASSAPSDVSKAPASAPTGPAAT